MTATDTAHAAHTYHAARTNGLCWGARLQGGGGCAQPHVCRGPDLYMKDEDGYRKVLRAPSAHFLSRVIRTKRLTSLKMRTPSDSVVLLVTRKDRADDTGRCTGTATWRMHLHTPGSKANNEGAGANDGGSRSAIALLVTRYALAIDERCAGTA